MIVCLCEGVSDREIQRVITQGSRSVPEVGRACGAGTGCGMCKCSVKAMLREAGCPAPGGTTTRPLAAGPQVV